ncbi:MerR family transcriptional regulator [Longispora albida]|uniref:MerR family transcriptional regulator n=1 Tax=Longispora albida TaxID=203523 RepID=UPI0003640CA3|nr:MerR family transcriptional regulator [Longispora albida]
MIEEHGEPGEFMLAGEFGAAARLSPKALRLYAEQGLLSPALTDPATGYRRYERGQLPRARLISRLRELGLPLARIAGLAGLTPEARDAELRAWLVAEEDTLRRRRDLVTALAGGDVPLYAEVALREVPERKVLSVERRVRVDGLDTFVTDAAARIRAHLAASGVRDDAPMRVWFHGLVTQDSDGPVEVTVPFSGTVEPAGDLSVRIEAARTEAYIPVPEAEASFPAILRVYDALAGWIDRERRLCTGSPTETYPGTGGAFLDIAYPVTTAERG